MNFRRKRGAHTPTTGSPTSQGPYVWCARARGPHFGSRGLSHAVLLCLCPPVPVLGHPHPYTALRFCRVAGSNGTPSAQSPACQHLTSILEIPLVLSQAPSRPPEAISVRRRHPLQRLPSARRWHLRLVCPSSRPVIQAGNVMLSVQERRVTDQLLLRGSYKFLQTETHSVLRPINASLQELINKQGLAERLLPGTS